MLEKSKKLFIDILLKLKIIKYKDDKNEETLTRFPLFIELFIALLIFNWLNYVVGNMWNFNFHHHIFISLITLYTLMVLVSYPVRFVLHRINKFNDYFQDKQH
jgi:uncharacterized membrane protein YadS